MGPLQFPSFLEYQKYTQKTVKSEGQKEQLHHVQSSFTSQSKS